MKVLLFILLLQLTSCTATRYPQESLVKKLLYEQNMSKVSSPCARAISTHIYKHSTLQIVEKNCQEDSCLITVKVESPKIPKKALQEAIKEALLVSLTPEKICEILARKIPQITFKEFETTCLKIRLKHSNGKWELEDIKKEPEEVCQTTSGS